MLKLLPSVVGYSQYKAVGVVCAKAHAPKPPPYWTIITALVLCVVCYIVVATPS